MVDFGVFAVALLRAMLLVDVADQPPRIESVSPNLGVQARAVDENGKVRVHFYFPMRTHQEVEIKGKGGGLLVDPPERDDWFSISRIVDGKSIRVFNANGQVLEPKLLIQRLEKQSRIVLFEGAQAPDPYYYGFFDKETVLFAGPSDQFIGMGAETTIPLAGDALHVWLGLISDPDYQLLFASNERGYFFAIWRDRDGDLLFSKYDTRDLKMKFSRHTEGSFQDPKTGVKFEHADSPKQSPAAVKINSKYTSVSRGLNATSRSVSLSPSSLSRGDLITFKNHNFRSVRVIFKETIDGGEEQVLLDRVVDLPGPPASK